MKRRAITILNRLPHQVWENRSRLFGGSDMFICFQDFKVNRINALLAIAIKNFRYGGWMLLNLVSDTKKN